MIDKKESIEDYLEKILMLKERNEIVRAIDLANFMNFSKASISIALKKLKSEDYLTVSDNGNIVLTEKGLLTAKETYKTHQLLSNFFIKIGVNEKQACIDACKIEHDLSLDTIEAIEKLNNKL